MKSTLNASLVKKASFSLFVSIATGFSFSQPAQAFDLDEVFKTMMCRMVAIETGQCRTQINSTTVTPQPNPSTYPAPNSPVPNSNPNSESISDQEETDAENSSESSQSVESSIFQYLDVSPNRK
jgi:hypothetical protein